MTIQTWFNSLDPQSILIGMGVIGLVWFCLFLIKKYLYPRKEYTLPQLQNWVIEAHKKLDDANNNLIQLSRAFKAIEETKE